MSGMSRSRKPRGIRRSSHRFSDSTDHLNVRSTRWGKNYTNHWGIYPGMFLHSCYSDHPHEPCPWKFHDLVCPGLWVVLFHSNVSTAPSPSAWKFEMDPEVKSMKIILCGNLFRNTIVQTLNLPNNTMCEWHEQPCSGLISPLLLMDREWQLWAMSESPRNTR